MNILKIKSKVLVTPNNCWEWQKSTNSAGYGQITEKGRYWLAHRYALSCVTEVKATDIVRHMCHNTRCCNPEHLLIGTAKENYADSVGKYNLSNINKRKKWQIASVSYTTSREALKHTGLSSYSLDKFTEDGIFNVEKYREGCKKAGWIPKI